MGLSDKNLTYSEAVFIAVLALVLLVGWVGLVLVQFSSFRATYLAILVGLVLLAGGVTLWAFRRRGPLSLGRLKVGRDEIIVAGLLVVSGLLFARPAQYLPFVGEPSIYANTAALLVRTGSLANVYKPLADLDWESKKLFYLSAADQIPDRPMTGYEGLVFEAFFITDAARGEVVASRPPLFIMWMAIFSLLFGQNGGSMATPVFGALSVVSVYLTGKRMFDWRVGLVGGGLLALSFPEVYYARTPYAEILAQFLLFSSIFMMAFSLDRGRPWGMVLAGAGFGQALLTRIDAAFVVIPIAALAVILICRERIPQGLALGLSFTAIALQAGLYTLTLNKPYVWSTAQLLQFRFGQVTLWLMVALAAIGMVLAAALAIALRARLARFGPHIGNWWARYGSYAAALTVISLAIYAYYVRPEYGKVVFEWGSNSYQTHDEDIVPWLGRYLSPLVFWLGIFGFTFLLRRIDRSMVVFFVLFCAVFGFLFLGQQFVTPIYPNALRRQMPEVVPSLMLLAAYALFALPVRSFALKVLRVAPIAFVVASYVVVLWPFLGYTEMKNGGDFIDGLARRFDRSDIIIFEKASGGRLVGWMAAPLWTVHGRDTLLLSRTEVESQALERAVQGWALQGRRVWFVSHSPEAPTVSGLSLGRPEWQDTWSSDMIGQSRDYFPATIWPFQVNFYGFRVTF